MENSIGIIKRPKMFGLAVLATVCAGVVAAQDIVPVSDLTGGTSVFVFRGASRAVAKKFVSQGRTVRSRGDRIETAKKVTRQYSTLAKVNPRRTRVEAVSPTDARLKDIPHMPKEQASRLFAGVGEYYMDRNNYDQSIDVFRESLDLDSTNAVAKTGLSEALSLKGNELLAKDNFPVARKFFEESLIYNDKNAPAYFGLAEVQTELGELESASATYEKALQFDKELTEIYVPLGILYYQSGISASPIDTAKIEKADNLLTKAVAQDANDAQAQYYLGLIRLYQGRDRDAVTAFSTSKRVDANYAEAFYGSGQSNSRLNNNQAAVEDFLQATKLKPNYFEAWFGLGSAYFELNDYQNAIASYETAKKLRNDNAEVAANLGDVYRQIGDFNKAESNYNLAGLFFERQKDFATNKETREIAGETYSKVSFAIAKQCEKNAALGQGCKWETAVKSLEKAAAINNSPNDYANLGWALHNAAKADIVAGRTAQGREKLIRARDNLKRAVDANPKYLEGPLLNLGMVYTDLGETKAAIDTLKQVIQKEPKWVFAINELGIAYLTEGNVKDAIGQFSKAIDRDNKFAAAYYNLAKAQFKNGNVGEASKAHAKLKSLGRNDLANRLTVETNGAVRS
ncbi:MAG: tetratricopeptide repeat protein [Pyrinomonadaceae bacterium]